MISASDVLQILSEIHQYSMVLVELRDGTTLGVLHSQRDKMTYFKVRGKLGQAERTQLLDAMNAGSFPDEFEPLSVEGFLGEIENRKAKHIWLETGGPERKEHGFVSIAELKAFFRGHSSK